MPGRTIIIYTTHSLTIVLAVGLFIAGNSQAADSLEKGDRVLWQDPGRGARNLFYGQGGERHQPAGTTFDFLEEQSSGSTPKFKVTDSSGTKWKVKLGVETKPETAATRLVWGAGYSTDEDYFLNQIHVRNLPAHLSRGQQYVKPGGLIRDARLERDDPNEKDAGRWKWKDNAFRGTKEWNGLRVLMSLMNNWDLKDVNNAVYFVKREEPDKGNSAPRYIYVVSDLGATFGPARLDMGRTHNKGELKSYARTSFIRKTESAQVSFSAPAPPSLPILFLNPFAYIRRLQLIWIGRDIPRADARWMGTILGRLTPAQIRDAFRAGGYSAEEVEGFAVIVEKRIAALRAL